MVDSGKGHGFLCPACKVELVMSDRQGIEIDYCPQCRGVWLDRGELDKIIEKSVVQAPQSAPPPQDYGGYPQQDSGHHGGYGKHGAKHGGYGHSGRRRSWLHDIFD